MPGIRQMKVKYEFFEQSQSVNYLGANQDQNLTFQLE